MIRRKEGSQRKCQMKLKSLHLLVKYGNRRGQTNFPRQRISELWYHDQEHNFQNELGRSAQTSFLCFGLRVSHTAIWTMEQSRSQEGWAVYLLKTNCSE